MPMCITPAAAIRAMAMALVTLAVLAAVLQIEHGDAPAVPRSLSGPDDPVDSVMPSNQPASRDK